MIVAAVAIFLCYQATCGDIGNFNPYLRGHSHSVEEHDGFQTTRSALCGREVMLRGEKTDSISTVRQSCLNVCLMEINPSCVMNRLSLRGGSGGSRTSSTKKPAKGNSKVAASSDRVVYGSQKTKHGSKLRSRSEESEMSSGEESESSNAGSSASQSDDSEDDVVRDKRSKYAPPRRSKSKVVYSVQALLSNLHDFL